MMTGLNDLPDRASSDNPLQSGQSHSGGQQASKRQVNGLRILVTGGSGFIGSHLVRRLRGNGALVSVLDLDPRGGADVIEFDVRDPSLGTVLARLKPDVVVHLAGQSKVVPSLANPLEDAQTNIIGTINVISAAIRLGVRRVVLVSSGGTIYGEGRPGHLATESQLRQPVSPYGLSKATADAYLAMLAGDAGVSLALGNVYGPGGAGVWAEFLAALRRGEPPRVAGDGTQTRDFVYVTDVCAAIVRSCVSRHTGTFNIGTGRATSVNALLATVSSVLGLTTDPVFTPWRDGEVRHNCLDIRRARRLLGWKPVVDLAEGIRRTDAADRVPAGGRWSA